MLIEELIKDFRLWCIKKRREIALSSGVDDLEVKMLQAILNGFQSADRVGRIYDLAGFLNVLNQYAIETNKSIKVVCRLLGKEFTAYKKHNNYTNLSLEVCMSKCFDMNGKVHPSLTANQFKEIFELIFDPQQEGKYKEILNSYLNSLSCQKNIYSISNEQTQAIDEFINSVKELREFYFNGEVLALCEDEDYFDYLLSINFLSPEKRNEAKSKMHSAICSFYGIANNDPILQVMSESDALLYKRIKNDYVSMVGLFEMPESLSIAFQKIEDVLEFMRISKVDYWCSETLSVLQNRINQYMSIIKNETSLEESSKLKAGLN